MNRAPPQVGHDDSRCGRGHEPADQVGAALQAHADLRRTIGDRLMLDEGLQRPPVLAPRDRQPTPFALDPVLGDRRRHDRRLDEHGARGVLAAKLADLPLPRQQPHRIGNRRADPLGQLWIDVPRLEPLPRHAGAPDTTTSSGTKTAGRYWPMTPRSPGPTARSLAISTVCNS